MTRRNPRKASTMNPNSSISSSMNTPNMPFLRIAAATLLAAGSLASDAQAATLAERENEFYRLVTIPIPEGIVLEAGRSSTSARIVSPSRRGSGTSGSSTAPWGLIPSPPT